MDETGVVFYVYDYQSDITKLNLAKTGILLIRQFVAIRILKSFFNRLGDTTCLIQRVLQGGTNFVERI